MRKLRKARSKKLAKKRACDLLDSDFDSDQDKWSSSPGIHVDKHVKLDKPVGIGLESTDTHPIKATKIDLDTTKINKIAIENTKTGKVTTVVAVMSIFGKKWQFMEC